MTIYDLLTETERGKCQIQMVRKGETLHHEGDPCLGVTYVLSGRIKIASYTSSGQEIVFNTLGAGQFFGNNLVFSSDPEYKGTVIAEEESKILYIPKSVLTEILKSNERFLAEYLRIQSDFGQSLNGKIKILSLGSAEERLDCALALGKGSIRFRSVQSLAAELGLQRETLSRLIHRLEREGKIVIEKDTIRIA